MQQFYKFVTWRLCVGQNVSVVSQPIIRRIKLHYKPLFLPLEGSGWSLRHPQHTQTSSNSSTIAADSSNGVYATHSTLKPVPTLTR
jgi:hypothetical protein